MLDIAIANRQELDHCIAVHQLGMVERMVSYYKRAQQVFELEAKFLKQYGIAVALSWSANYYKQGYVAFMQNKQVTIKQVDETNWYECCQLQISEGQQLYLEPNAIYLDEMVVSLI